MLQHCSHHIILILYSDFIYLLVCKLRTIIFGNWALVSHIQLILQCDYYGRSTWEIIEYRCSIWDTEKSSCPTPWLQAYCNFCNIKCPKVFQFLWEVICVFELDIIVFSILINLFYSIMHAYMLVCHIHLF